VKKEHERFIDEIDALNDKTDSLVMSDFDKILRKSFELANGNVDKLPLIIKRAKKLMMIKATAGAIKTVREVRIKSRAFAKVKLGRVQLQRDVR
jgi:hypothetical protein